LIRGVGGGPTQAIVVGEPSPGTGGFFAGSSFAGPVITDAGDLVFRSTVASGPSAVGLYRWSRGETTALVRAGDAAPIEDALPFLDIVGQHDVSDAGTVVFAALVEGLDRGVYAVEGGSLVRVAVKGDLVRILSGTTATFDTLLPNPSIAPDGTIAFRARVEFEQSGVTRRRDGIFLKSGAQIRAAVLEDDLAPTGESFDLFREVAAASGGKVAFVADLGNGDTTRRGLFVADAGDVRTVVVEGDRIGDRVVGFVGGPELNDRGIVAQLARLEGTDAERTVLLRGTPARVDVVAQVGDESPAGGVYRSLGRPAMNREGAVAFRATFEAGTGGSPGLLTATESSVQPAVGIGDPGPSDIRGQFVAFNQRVSLNAGRTIAFLGSLAGGTVREGVFVGDPTSLGVPALKMKVGSSSKPDRLKLKIRLASGSATRLLDLASSRVRITVQDDAGARWSELISPGGLERRGRAWVYSRKPIVPKVKLTVAKNGLIRGVMRANPDLTGGGLFPIEPPVTVDVEVADVSASTSLACAVSAKRVRCR
ncbi:MAG TPA: choice-of-anchor tandem repeat NxxGxxAF-containing protein, partial [Actinomycetota bacterium]